MIRRIHLAVSLGAVDALESGLDEAMGPTWLRCNRSTFDMAVASFQVTPAEAIKLVKALKNHPDARIARGPDDDGADDADAVVVDVGTPMPADPARARRTWARAVADLALARRQARETFAP